MRKLLAFLLAAAMLVSTVACGMTADDGKIPGDGDPTNNDNTNNGTNNDINDNNSNNNNDSTNNGSNGGNNTQTPPTYQNAHELLAAIWSNYEQNEQFPIMGGDYDNVVENAPGAFDLTHTDAAANIDSLLSFPSEEIGKIDSAASIIHGMNTNMFTCGAFHVTDAGEVQSVADRIKNHILTKQFLCGSPEHLTILRVPGNYLIVLYGIKDNVGAFAQKTSALIPNTTTLTEQSLSR
jgi:hypothetical protein